MNPFLDSSAPLTESAIHASLVEGAHGVGEASRVKNPLRKGIYELWGLTPTLEVVDEETVQCPLECHLCKDIIIKLVQCISDYVGCGQVLGLLHVYPGFPGSVRRPSLDICVHDATDLAGDHTLHPLVD